MAWHKPNTAARGTWWRRFAVGIEMPNSSSWWDSCYYCCVFHMLPLSLLFWFILTESMAFQHCKYQRLPLAMPMHTFKVLRSVDMSAQWMSPSWFSQLPRGPFAHLMLNLCSVDRQPPDAQDAAFLRRWRLHVGRPGSPQSTKTQPDIYEGGRWYWFFQKQNCLTCIFW
jgi:hypothetical protein